MKKKKKSKSTIAINFIFLVFQRILVVLGNISNSYPLSTFAQCQLLEDFSKLHRRFSSAASIVLDSFMFLFCSKLKYHEEV